MIRDLRKYTQQTHFRLVVGMILLGFFVGAGLISLIFGWQAGITGVLCMGAALLPVVIIWGILTLMGWIVRRSGQDE